MNIKNLSLLFPNGEDSFKTLSDTSIHDLGIDFICQKVTDKYEEQEKFTRIFSKMSDDPAVSQFRIDVFNDIYNNPQMTLRLMEVLEHINYEKQYSGFSGHYEETNSAWELLHRLEELNDYIKSVEALQVCLNEFPLKSEGMKNLKNHINSIYSENGFSELKSDIQNLKTSTKELKSVTLGINLNEKFEAHGIGVISFNSKPFSKSLAVGNFVSKLSKSDTINPDTDWKENYKYQPFTDLNADIFDKLISIASPGDKKVENSTLYMDKIANSMLAGIVHKLKTTLKKYVFLPVTDMTNLIPEFIFYIRFADYFRKAKEKGFNFCKPSVAEGKDSVYMNAKGFYNFKLLSASEELSPDQIIPNDLAFNRENLVYILTGANRGGKTTLTQAAGLLFVLAQAGLYVPGTDFEFSPADSIFTHFPADEDKTMDLGRLGEECKRFKEMYSQATGTSLMLLNETYSTTSFEEGYYIAEDSVKAILVKGIRTIYNTHMHKLGTNLNQLNSADSVNKAQSLVVKSDGGKRSYKAVIAPPEGSSFAKDIAEKYGVTFEMLTK